MHRIGPILDACRRLRDRGEPGVLATVVEVEGSAYRRPGARMLIPARGAPAGMVSGGCLESDLAERAREVLVSGEPRTVLYDMRSPDDIVWGLGLGCNGVIRVLLERLDAERAPLHLEFLEQCRVRREAATVVTLFESGPTLGVRVGDRMLLRGDEVVHGFDLPELDRAAQAEVATGRSRILRVTVDAGDVALLIERIDPAISLVVCGAGSDARPLVGLAGALGWEVSVLDHRPSYARADRFPEARQVREVDFGKLAELTLQLDRHTAVVLMTHHFVHDRALLEWASPSVVPYIGLLGPRQRTRNLLSELAERGASSTSEQTRRLFGPVGLDIGSESAEEIALAIVAEIQAVFSASPAGFLRDRRGPLHDWIGDGE